MKKEPITSLSDFFNKIPSHSRGLSSPLIFRGQGEDHPLLPSIFRKDHACHNGDWIGYEQKIMNIFEREAVQSLANEPTNIIDWIYLAQHHGVPTRVLDWTTSAVCALYFAVEDLNESEDGVVLSYKFGEKRLVTYKNYKELKEIKKPVFYIPKHLNQRMSAQSACAVIYPLPVKNKSEFTPLELTTQTFNKFVIPGKCKQDILFKLDDIGINAHSIYPDLDGLAKEIKMKIKRKKQ